MSSAVAVVLFFGVTVYAVFAGADFGAGFWDLIAGGPEDCLEQIAALRERVPVGCLILRMQWLGMPHALVARAITLVGERLLPALRRL